MTLFDHLLALALVLVFPAWVAWNVPHLLQRIEADPLNARTKEYIWGITSQGGATVALIAAWWWIGRPVREIGLRLPDTANASSWSLVIAVGGIAVFVQQARAALKSSDTKAKVREHIESQPGLRALLPATPREVRAFVAVAITAGICEEVLYRGYLLWYLQSLMPWSAAVVTAIVVFGVGHAYQGVQGILSTGVAGAIAMAIYLLTGSLLAPIVLHTALDLVNGLTIYTARFGEKAPVRER